MRFLSVEPLLEDLGGSTSTGIDWVIVGGESGPARGRWSKNGSISIRDQCQRAGVPFFFKQWGGVRKGVAGRELEGKTHDSMPGRATGRTPVATRIRLEMLEHFNQIERDLQPA